ncbi:MAG: hypothetical protein RR949_06895, partial [Oscillospiraceae bacterium]
NIMKNPDVVTEQYLLKELSGGTGEYAALVADGEYFISVDGKATREPLIKVNNSAIVGGPRTMEYSELT